MENNYMQGEPTNAREIKDNVMFEIINYEINKDILRYVPHRKFLDTAVVYYILTDGSDMEYGVINNEDAAKNNITEEDLWKMAFSNTKEKGSFLINDILQYLQKTNGNEEKEDETFLDMFIFTNQNGFKGAAGILYKDMLKGFCEENGYEGVYILPSSIHETLLVPIKKREERTDLEKDPLYPMKLTMMVRDINNTDVRDEEFLSNDIYEYNLKKNGIKIVK